MTHHMTPLTAAILTLLAAIVGQAGGDFTPGCSFVNDQCVYTVQLGHEKQCDAPAPTNQNNGNESCCSDLTKMIYDLQNHMSNLQNQVRALQSLSVSGTVQSGPSTQASPDLHEQLRQLQAIYNSTLEELRYYIDTLNATRQNLTNERAHAAKEIKDLHDRLSNTTLSLYRCQTAIGAEASANVSDLDAGNHNVLYCSFDDDDCGFTYDAYRDIRFGRLKASSDPSSQGPRYDHSKGLKTGYALKLDTYATALNDRSSSNTVKKATAITPTFPPAPAYCIEFYYFMKGKDVQSLSVNLEINGGSGYPIYTRTGRISDHWQLAQVNVDSEYTSHDFKILFTMTTRAYRKYLHSYSPQYGYLDAEGGIAVDDLYIYNTTCNNIPQHPSLAYTAVYNGTTSYYTFHTKPMTWDRAYDTCRQAGPWSALVSIETTDEQNFIAHTIQNDQTLSLVGQSGFYTSGTDKDSEHAFTWTDTGIPRAVPTGFWHQGQPNNVGGDQDCLLLQYASDDFRWGDVDCDTKHPFICEVYGTP